MQLSLRFSVVLANGLQEKIISGNRLVRIRPQPDGDVLVLIEYRDGFVTQFFDEFVFCGDGLVYSREGGVQVYVNALSPARIRHIYDTVISVLDEFIGVPLRHVTE